MSADVPRSLVVERELPHPPEKVWRALTDGTLMKAWLMDNDFQPIVGHAFSFRARPMPHWDGVIDSEVMVIEPGRKLSYAWRALGLDSVVVWTVVATERGTLLRLEHAGFRPDQKAAYNGANHGWQAFIGNLERVVAALS